MLLRIQVRVDLALQANWNERDAAWQAAHQVATEFVAANADVPRISLVYLQDALTTLSHAEALRDESILDPRDAQPQDTAAALFRQAVARLDQVADQIESTLAVQANRNSADELSTAQLLALTNHVALEKARCYLGMATLVADDERRARIDALTRLEGQLQDLLNKIPASDSLWWQAQLLRSQCLRLAEQTAAAAAIWQQVSAAEVPDDQRPAWWREQIRLAIDGNQTDRLWQQWDSIAPWLSRDPELDLAIVELFLFEAAHADPQQQAPWQQRAAQAIESIAQTHGEYWSRRANLVVAQRAPATSDTTHGDLVLRLIDELLRKNEAAEAIRLLDLSAARTAESKDSDTAANLSFRAAEIAETQNDHQSASDRFRLLAAAFPDHPRAAEAHLLAIWNLAQILSADRASMDQYVQLLQSHLQRWPQSQTSAEAASWLAPVLRYRADYQGALETAARVPATSQFFAAAVATAQSASLDWVLSIPDPAEESGQPGRQQTAQQIVDLLKDWHASIGDADPSAESGQSAPNAVLELRFLIAQIELAYLPVDLVPTEQEFDRLATSADQLGDAALTKRARSFVALCRSAISGRPAEEQIDLSAIVGTRWWFRAWQRFAMLSSGTGLAGLMLQVSDSTDFATVEWPTPEDELAWRLAAADSRWAVGDRRLAKREFEAILADHPRSLTAYQMAGRRLSDSSDSEDLQTALEIWRLVAARTPPYSEPWFEAKYSVARTLVADGESAEAEKMLRFLKTVPPGWSGSTRANEFEQLLQQVQAELDGQ